MLVIVGMLLLAIVAAATWRVLGRAPAVAGGPALAAGDARAPEGVRIRVEVLNATRTRGLARQATRHLRNHGFDVVLFGTSPETHDSTVVIDRTGHPEWAALVAEVMGGARVRSVPDSLRYLDITVLVGASWRAPAEPLYP
jgi:hypothetical protein